MPFKSIVAVASGEDDDAPLLAAAAGLAAQFGAHARVTPAFPDAAAAFLSYGASFGRGDASVVAQRIAASEREAQDKLETLARQTAERAGVGRNGRGGALSVEKRELVPAVALARAAALADAVLFSAQSVTRDAPLRGLFAEALIEMRAPILLVKGDILPLRAAAIAWDGSAQSGRAVRAAIPLLALAEEVWVLTNVQDGAIEPKTADAGRIGAYLELNGIRNVGARTVQGEHVAASLIAAAQAENCDVLVAGAYGRPRLQELVLGGSTRAFVTAPGRPSLFMAH